jgi:YesN/AraC family two-component response regulator
MNREHVDLSLKNLISKSGIRLIDLFFKNNENIDIEFIRLGNVGLFYNNEIYSYTEIKSFFENDLEFEVIENKDLQLVEKIKIAAIELIHYANNSNSLIRNSDYISQKLQLPYDKIAKLFSAYSHRTLEQYILALKIEKIKSLLLSNEFSLSEISYLMGYSSVQYLSNQFKKSTGFTVSEFKNAASHQLTALEDI